MTEKGEKEVILIDLGIVKCHFALAAGAGSFTWADKP